MHLWSWALGVWLCSSRDVLHPTRDVTSRVLDRDDLDVDTCPLTYIQSHRRRSDWNSGGGLTIKVLLYRQNTFSYIVMQVIWCLKLCNMTKSGGTIPSLQILGADLSHHDLRPCTKRPGDREQHSAN